MNCPPNHWLTAIPIRTKQDFCSHAEANPKLYRGRQSPGIAKTSSSENRVRAFTLCDRATASKWYDVTRGVGTVEQDREPRNRVATQMCATVVLIWKPAQTINGAGGMRIRKQKNSCDSVAVQPGGIRNALHLAVFSLLPWLWHTRMCLQGATIGDC